jgi:hypothetical protein
MIIAIPSVLDTMNKSRRQLFVEYAGKVLIAAQTQYVTDSSLGNIAGAGYYVYDIKTDLGLQSVGSYNGWIVVNATDVDKPTYWITLYDNNYQVVNYNAAYLDKLDSSVDAYGKGTDVVPSSAKGACNKATGTTTTDCYNHDGYKIV